MGPLFITREKMKVADSFPMNQHIVVMLKSLFLEKRENFYMEYNRVQTEHRCCCYYPLIIAYRREGIIGFGMNSKKGSKIGQNENLGSK